MIQFTTQLYSDSFHYKKVNSQMSAKVYVLGTFDEKKISHWVKELAPEWQQATLLKTMKEVTHFSSAQGPIWILARKPSKNSAAGHEGRLAESDYAWFREQTGALLGYFKAYDVESAQFYWQGTELEQELGALVGLNLAAYHFKTHNDKKTYKALPEIFHDKAWPKATLTDLRARSLAVNLARHLVNCPPNDLNPKTYSQFVQSLFKGSKNLKVDVWNSERLKKEGMGLHLGVGQGAAESPCMVHLKYRPRGSGASKSKKMKPVAFVGKGVTFDTGGLDIKPSSGMRLMKKDMGGSAGVLGLALWAVQSGYPAPLDFYLGLAENSVDAHGMRPSDVLTARNGMKVEIHNTDAEGRLVLADVLDVAVTQKGQDEPDIVVDLATLTGAIKVALGADFAGLFANDDVLAEELNRAGTQAGDMNWRMPLVPKYNSGMNSAFADIVNAVDGFGGAITAALFLERFVRGKKWAHLDIYAWNDKPTGSLAFSGGSGQAVQCLVEWLKARV